MNATRYYLEGYKQLSQDRLMSLPLAMRLVLEHGQHWQTAKYLPGGTPKECFCNSMNLAMDDGLQYVEGWALPKDLFPVEHAWNLDADGQVLDNTWDHGMDYLGVVWKPEWAFSTTVKIGYYGILPSLHAVSRKMGFGGKDIEEFYQYLVSNVQSIARFTK